MLEKDFLVALHCTSCFVTSIRFGVLLFFSYAQIDYTGVDMSSPCFNCSQSAGWNSTQPCVCSIPFYLDQPYEVFPENLPVVLLCVDVQSDSLNNLSPSWFQSTGQRLHVLRPLQLLPKPPPLRQVARRQPAEWSHGIPHGMTELTLQTSEVFVIPPSFLISHHRCS